MTNSTIAAISIALNREFGERYKNYVEEVKQGFEKPCFFISCIFLAQRLLLGERYLQENGFCIRYFPGDGGRAEEECNMVAGRLFCCLEWIKVGDSLVRGTGMRAETVDGILNFFVDYDRIARKVVDLDPMEELSEDVSVKKGGR